MSRESMCSVAARRQSEQGNVAMSINQICPWPFSLRLHLTSILLNSFILKTGQFVQTAYWWSSACISLWTVPMSRHRQAGLAAPHKDLFGSQLRCGPAADCQGHCKATWKSCVKIYRKTRNVKPQIEEEDEMGIAGSSRLQEGKTTSWNGIKPKRRSCEFSRQSQSSLCWCWHYWWKMATTTQWREVQRLTLLLSLVPAWPGKSLQRWWVLKLHLVAS